MVRVNFKLPAPRVLHVPEKATIRAKEKTHVTVNSEGLYAFGYGNNSFPKKVISYRKSMYIVPDWDVNHDHGDEDDGEHKIIEAAVNGTPWNLSPVIIRGLK